MLLASLPACILAFSEGVAVNVSSKVNREMTLLQLSIADISTSKRAFPAKTAFGGKSPCDFDQSQPLPLQGIYSLPHFALNSPPNSVTAHLRIFFLLNSFITGKASLTLPGVFLNHTTDWLAYMPL